MDGSHGKWNRVPQAVGVQDIGLRKVPEMGVIPKQEVACLDGGVHIVLRSTEVYRYSAFPGCWLGWRLLS